MPKVSVIIPVYNVEKYLTRCLQSVCGQTMKDIEIICVNDGSTDNSAHILAEFAAQDSRVKVITQENRGLSEARNRGLDVAEGQYIAFVDSDDFVAPIFVQTLVTAAEETNSDIVNCNFIKVTDETVLKQSKNTDVQVFANPLQQLLIKSNYLKFNVWNKLYKRSFIGEFRFAKGLYFEDWIFNTCLFAKAQKLAYVKAQLYGYQTDNLSIMRSPFDEKKLQDYVQGIELVHEFYQQNYPELWRLVKKTRISRTVKMLMNSTLRAKNVKLMEQAKNELQRLYQEQKIGYRGLSLPNKLKFYKFLH